MQKIPKIYLDYQATTPLDPEAFRAMEPFFRVVFGNPHSNDHAFGWEAAKAVGSAAESIGQMVGADPDEVIFTSGATEANNLAILGLARNARHGQRRKLFAGATEHKCVLAAIRAVNRELGFETHLVPVDQHGIVDLEWLARHLDEQALLVSVMAVNNEIGTIAPIEEVSRIARSAGALLHVDAAQAPYAIPTQALGTLADLVSLSAHKMYGPKGVGALFVRRDVQQQIEPIIHGGGQQNSLRSGTVPTPLVVAMGVCAELHKAFVESHGRNSLRKGRDRLWELIKASFPSARLNGPPLHDRHPGNLNIFFPGQDAKDLLLRMQPHVAASAGSACASGFEEPSHVLRAIGLDEQSANCSIRFSVGKQTTMQEIDEAAEIIIHALMHGAK